MVIICELYDLGALFRVALACPGCLYSRLPLQSIFSICAPQKNKKIYDLDFKVGVLL